MASDLEVLILIPAASHFAANHPSSESWRSLLDEAKRTTSSPKIRDGLHLEILSINIMNRTGDKGQPWRSPIPIGNEQHPARPDTGQPCPVGLLLPPRLAPAALRPQLMTAASTMVARNRAHSDSISPANLRNAVEALPEVGVEDHLDRFFSQAFPANPHYPFGSYQVCPASFPAI
ncbi:hypothetical protein L3Q82_003011 [Scortum barcoo]|uniref:Uncharacterized protein n=1 Tax=Scortum barcoo TaxID=214431 RepID=A0ACB8VQU5_9TELE|nr:hypothetical protein L3Q82_003011 [Scortum barcoo]